MAEVGDAQLRTTPPSCPEVDSSSPSRPLPAAFPPDLRVAEKHKRNDLFNWKEQETHWEVTG